MVSVYLDLYFVQASLISNSTFEKFKQNLPELLIVIVNSFLQTRLI